MEGDPWQEEGRPAHRDLLDRQHGEFISYLPREAVVPLAQWRQISRLYDRPDIEAMLLDVLHLAPSIEGRRAGEIVQALQPAQGVPSEHRDHVRHDHEPEERAGRRDRV